MSPFARITTPQIKNLKSELIPVEADYNTLYKRAGDRTEAARKAEKRWQRVVYSHRFPTNYHAEDVLDDFEVMREEALNHKKDMKKIYKLERKMDGLIDRIRSLQEKEYRRLQLVKEKTKLNKKKWTPPRKKQPIEEDMPKSTASLISTEARKIGGAS